MSRSQMSWKNPGEVWAWKCGTNSLSRSEVLHFINSTKSPPTKIDGPMVSFRRRRSNWFGRPRRMLIWTFEGNTERTVSMSTWFVQVGSSGSPDGTWPDCWLSKMIEMRKVGLGTTFLFWSQTFWVGFWPLSSRLMWSWDDTTCVIRVTCATF